MNENNYKKKLVGILSGKGGVGKSTLTEITATFINRYYNYKVAIIDADEKDKTILEHRKDELKELKTASPNNSLYKAAKQLANMNKKIYPVFDINAYELEKIAQIKNNRDITFIDIPGSLGVKGISEIFYFLDYIIIPTKGTEKIFKSTIKTIKHIKEIKKIQKARLKDFAVIINFYDDRVFKKENDAMISFFKKYNIKVLNPVYKDIDLERKKASTIKSIEAIKHDKKNIVHFVESFLNFIDLK